MTTLASVKSHLIIMGIVPMSDKHLPSLLQPHKSTINFIYTLSWFVSLVTYSMAAFYFAIFDANTFVEYAECGFYCSVTFLHVSAYAILVQNRSQLFDLFEDSDRIVQKRSKNPMVRLIYAQENEKTTELSESLLKSAFVFAEMFLFPNAMWSFYKYYTTDLGEDAFQLLFPSKIPWNWKSPRGYLITVCVQYVWIHSGIFSVICTLPLFAGFCSLFEAFTMDINKALVDLNDELTDDRVDTYNPNANTLYLKLTQIASFHSDAQELTERYSHTYRSLITISFAVSSVQLCSALLGLNVVIHIGIADTLRLFVCLSVMMIYLVLLCLLGDDVTIRFNGVHDSIWKLSWYELPLSSQKLLPMILMSAQKAVYIKGYMNMLCTPESVKKIMKSAFSFFTVLREFEQ